jgi:hypothetical protein
VVAAALFYGSPAAVSEERIAFWRIEEIESEAFVVCPCRYIGEGEYIHCEKLRNSALDVVNLFRGEWRISPKIGKSNRVSWHYDSRGRVEWNFDDGIVDMVVECCCIAWTEPHVIRGSYQNGIVLMLVDSRWAPSCVGDCDFVKKSLTNDHRRDFGIDSGKPRTLVKSHLIQGFGCDFNACFRGNGGIVTCC